LNTANLFTGIGITQNWWVIFFKLNVEYIDIRLLHLKNVQELNTIKIKYRFICERIKCHHSKLMLLEKKQMQIKFIIVYQQATKQSSAINKRGSILL
jgi:hypothetical protein